MSMLQTRVCFVWFGLYFASTLLQSFRDARFITSGERPHKPVTDGQLDRTTDLPQTRRKASSHEKFSPLVGIELIAVRDQVIANRRPLPLGNGGLIAKLYVMPLSKSLKPDQTSDQSSSIRVLKSVLHTVRCKMATLIQIKFPFI